MQKYSNINNWNKGKNKMKNNLLIFLISRQIGIHCFKNKFLKKKKKKERKERTLNLFPRFVFESLKNCVRAISSAVNLLFQKNLSGLIRDTVRISVSVKLLFVFNLGKLHASRGIKYRMKIKARGEDNVQLTRKLMDRSFVHPGK